MYDSFGESDARSMPRHLFWGAIRLDHATAVRADISKQNYSVCPRHWYIDATYRCPRCRKEFVFTVAEQRFWYEQLHSWIDSGGKYCRDCRSELRHLRKTQQEYDRDIKRVLTRAASVQDKRRLLRLIETLEHGGAKLSAGMKRNRQTLQTQLKREVK